MTSRRDLGDRVAGGAVAAGGALLAAYLIWYVGGWGGETLRAYVTDGIYPPLALLFTVLAVRAVRTGADARTRAAWSFIALAFACQLVAHTSWFVEDAILHSTTYPSFADYWFLAFVPFMFVALLLLAGVRRTRRDKIKLALDALIVGASTFMVLWYLVLGPILVTDGAGLSEIVYSAALPVGDLLLVLALATVLLRRATAAGTPVRLLAAGVVTYVIADVYYGYIQLHEGFVGGTWPDLFWLLGCYLFTLAAYRQCRRAGDGDAAARHRRAVSTWLPYGAIALAYGLLGTLAREQGMYPFGGMIIGAVLLTGLVVARQMYALRENRDLAVTDPLTGLANRTLVGERLIQLSAQPLRAGRHAAVLIVDLDHFKRVNDTYGHDAGDAVLSGAAAALRSVIRAGDTAGRLGGDEFAVILQNLPDADTAARIAERLVEALRTPVIFGDRLLAVEASIGVAVRDERTVDGEELMRHADTAMYSAKRAGRGRYAVYQPELDSRARDAELRHAIDNGELVVFFQPAVELGGGRIEAVEALVRWNHPERGLLMPGDFIALAEETGAVVPLGERVLRDACREVVRWQSTVPGSEHVRLSVNLSPNQVLQPELVDTVSNILDETGFPAHRLILELTEGVMLEPDAAVVARLEKLRAMGISIAVDDFGTGYSALTYLRRLPVDILKIDRSFVTGIADDPEARTVAEAVVRLGMAFRMNVVAEGIETADQARGLAAMGCGFGQGFHFYRPMDGEAAAEALRTAYDFYGTGD
ncbi:putative bifunctional diguanylate cyclase/phosphodiesterase [Nucisporomicrobium flavum]|uniref:putative bifunctional diguanylate cyclase/phosphodiesterase n=1 Tax=Nucisporomicrobium flavum TaxID=2785915 RepID=UPI0027DB25C8|nr:EAL domain-containing protein [Nucisporomicrobium flavum]